MLKRRSRIVSFRLSDEEYDSLKSVSVSRGARSVSEFTRSVACNSAEDGSEALERTLRAISEHVEAIDRKLQTLTEALLSRNNAIAGRLDDGIEEPLK